eukprot:TRINITY_DN3051_c0_g2_i3.p1 TRINITY_DN3051_c0_g2~~TRINITY_DN3051_c0_g2_i3.p1  ORF type:complete len:383 (-),score=86.59 TRINITY_DN3051_c0_g2_i3:1200-2348(-)
MQFLGRLMEYFLSRSNRTISILAATSGDTGSAAMHAVKNRKGIECFILFPGNNRISPQQEIQMTRMVAPNLHVFVGEDLGSDELDVVMRNCLDDLPFKQQYSLCTINSFNWGRVMCQIVNYVYLYCQYIKDLQTESLPVVNFVVPSGGMGNAAAGYFARIMGLPIRIVASSNENDVIDQIIRLNLAKRRQTLITISPSLDIQVPYNIERIIFAAMQVKDDGVYNKELIKTDVPTLYVAKLSGGESISIDEATHKTIAEAFITFQANSQDIYECIRNVHQEFDYALDPHSAIAVRAIQKISEISRTLQHQGPVICMATAHPAKFLKTMKIALPDADIEIPTHLKEYLESTQEGDVVRCRIESDCIQQLRDKIVSCHGKAKQID